MKRVDSNFTSEIYHSMKIKSLLLLLVLCSPFISLGLTKQYCLTLRDDPATTMVIGWGGDNGTVYYGTTDEGTNYTAYPNNHPSDRTGNAHGHTRHFSRLTGLTPNTLYYFVIRDDNGVVTDRFKFKTLSDDPNVPLSYVTGGDSRDGFKVLGLYVEDCPSGDCLDERREGNELVSKIRPDFVAFNGDFVMNQITSNTTNEWDSWFDDWQLSISQDGRMYPMVHTQGNHEDNQDVYHLFDIPQEEYYALNLHGGLLRLYILNSELNACNDANQLNWLLNDFQLHSTGNSTDPIWKFAQYHIPTYGMANNYGLVQEQMTCWVNLFEQFDVRMVSESHGHCTKWSHPCIANSSESDFEVDHQNGIVYIGEGQWGAPHRELDFSGPNQKPYIRDQDVFDNFFYIQVKQDSTIIRCVKFENISNIVASTSDELGKNLPAGTTIWSPSNGDRVILTNETGDLSTDNNAMNPTSVYPIPAENIVNVAFEKHDEGTIEIYDALGKLCVNETYSGTSKSVDLTPVCSGVSYMYIKSESGSVQVHKIVKR